MLFVAYQFPPLGPSPAKFARVTTFPNSCNSLRRACRTLCSSTYSWGRTYEFDLLRSTPSRKHELVAVMNDGRQLEIEMSGRLELHVGDRSIKPFEIPKLIARIEDGAATTRLVPGSFR